MYKGLSKEKLKDMYIKMQHVRFFEEKVAYLFTMGKVHGTTHLYAGEEASAIGACAALDVDDLIVSTHRGHGHCIGKGIDLKLMMAELLGKEDGYCKGKGGSMHIADLTKGNLGANGVVGGGQPLSVGAGLTIKMQKKDAVVVCFFGDGSTNEGSFHESINLASVWKLPIIFLCENNKYGMSTSTKRSMNIEDISIRASSYGIQRKQIDGNNIFEVYEAIKEAKEYVKVQGPVLIVADTYRYMGHSKSDANVYRAKSEIEDWKKNRDPIKGMANVLISEKIFTAEEITQLDTQAKKDIEDATEWADSRPYPSLETIMMDVYA